MSNGILPNDPDLSARVERLERDQRALLARREILNRDLIVILLSVSAATLVVAVLLVAQQQGWIAQASIARDSWVVIAATAGTVINVFLLLLSALSARRMEQSLRQSSDENYRGSAAAAE